MLVILLKMKQLLQQGLDLNSFSAFSMALQSSYESTTSPDERKNRGQFFTPYRVAQFMAKLFTTFPRQFTLLDPGAGTGTLSAAVCKRVCGFRSPRRITLHLFENDSEVIPLLKKNMQFCSHALKESGHSMDYTIHKDDFILANQYALHQPRHLKNQKLLPGVDAVIMNPPYFKIQKNSQYAKIMNTVVHGQPNIYALFMALSAELLRPGGQLVAITPRSFCGGLYFRGFRQWFFKRMSLYHIHLFESRKDTFRSAKVLQESIITRSVKTETEPNTIAISTSFGGNLLQKPPSRQISTSTVIDNTYNNMVVRIPESPQDERIIEIIESWPNRFEDHELRVSTGPVVTFRAKKYLLHTINGKNSVPLISVHNVRPFETLWPLKKNGKHVGFKLCTESLKRKLLVQNKNYVLLRRFSSKEERRRLTASCFFKTKNPKPYVALENHTNYISHALRELTPNETFGIAAIFNSVLLDRYFRTLSGNTQVNATELRTMNFPDLKILSRIGQRIKKLRVFNTADVEHIVLDELKVNGGIEKYLMELAQ